MSLTVHGQPTVGGGRIVPGSSQTGNGGRVIGGGSSRNNPQPVNEPLSDSSSAYQPIASSVNGGVVLQNTVTGQVLSPVASTQQRGNPGVVYSVRSQEVYNQQQNVASPVNYSSEQEFDAKLQNARNQVMRPNDPVSQQALNNLGVTGAYNTLVHDPASSTFNYYASGYQTISAAQKQAADKSFASGNYPVGVVERGAQYGSALVGSYYAGRVKHPELVATDVGGFFVGGVVSRFATSPLVSGAAGAVSKTGAFASEVSVGNYFYNTGRVGGITLSKLGTSAAAFNIGYKTASAGLIAYTGYSVGKAAIYEPSSVTNPKSVFSAGVIGGALNVREVGLVQGRTRFGITSTSDLVGGTRGYGEDLAAPKKGVQALNSREGTVGFSFYGNELPRQSIKQTTAFRLEPVEGGLLRGRAYTDVTTTNPINGKTLYSSKTYEVAGRGTILAGVNLELGEAFVTKSLSRQKLGTTPTGENVVVVRGRTSFLNDNGRGFDVLNSQRRASVSTTQTYNAGRKVLQVGDPETLQATIFTKGQRASVSEGVAGNIQGSSKKSYVKQGVDLLEQTGLYSKKPSFKESKRASLFSESSFQESESYLRSTKREVGSGDLGSVGFDRPRLVEQSNGLVSGLVPAIKTRSISKQSSPTNLFAAPKFQTIQETTPVQRVAAIPKAKQDVEYGVRLSQVPVYKQQQQNSNRTVEFFVPPEAPFFSPGGFGASLPQGGKPKSSTGTRTGARKAKFEGDFTSYFLGQIAPRGVKRVSNSASINPVLRRYYG